jgi:DNA-binding MarR family transcriptional regulator
MATSEKTLFDLPAQERASPDRSFIARWQHEELFKNGFVAVPVLFLQLYARLKPHPLTAGEALFTLELMSFKWGSDAPFPSYERIAKRMGVTTKAARRYAKDMEAKGYLQREKRIGLTNRFDLTGLFDALLKAAERAEAEQASKEGNGHHV